MSTQTLLYLSKTTVDITFQQNHCTCPFQECNIFPSGMSQRLSIEVLLSQLQSQPVNIHKRLHCPTVTIPYISQCFISLTDTIHAQVSLPLRCNYDSTGEHPLLLGEEHCCNKSLQQRVRKQANKSSETLNVMIILQFGVFFWAPSEVFQVLFFKPAKPYLVATQTPGLALSECVSFKENPPLLPFHLQLISALLQGETQMIFLSFP